MTGRTEGASAYLQALRRALPVLQDRPPSWGGLATVGADGVLQLDDFGPLLPTGSHYVLRPAPLEGTRLVRESEAGGGDGHTHQVALPGDLAGPHTGDRVLVHVVRRGATQEVVVLGVLARPDASYGANPADDEHGGGIKVVIVAGPGIVVAGPTGLALTAEAPVPYGVSGAAVDTVVQGGPGIAVAGPVLTPGSGGVGVLAALGAGA